MPELNKGDFTQQGIDGDVSALIRLNDKRIVKLALSSDDEDSSITISGTVFDTLNNIETPLGGDDRYEKLVSRTITEAADLPATVGNSAFRTCNLTKIDLTGVTKLEPLAFENVKATLDYLVIPDGCAFDSGDGAQFSGTSLNHITATHGVITDRASSTSCFKYVDTPLYDLHSGATALGQNAFAYSKNATVLILRSPTVLTGSNFTSNSFLVTNTVATVVYVPSALIDSYKTATRWKNYLQDGNTYNNTVQAIEGSAYENVDWWKA